MLGNTCVALDTRIVNDGAYSFYILISSLSLLAVAPLGA